MPDQPRLISRLRLDANLCDPPPPRRPGQRGRPPVSGRPPVKGNKRHKLSAELTDPAARWRRVTVTGWYGLAQTRCLDILSDTAVWYGSGLPVVPLRWVLVRDPKGVFEPQAFLCTDTAADPVQILLWFVLRWQMEVTFEESRAHLGGASRDRDAASRRRANGPIRRSPAPRPCSSVCSPWSHCGPTHC